MAKKVAGFIKLQIPAGKANPSPPVGPALGQRGLNIMEFCKAFNAATQKAEAGAPIPVVITAYQDRTFTFTMKKPPVSFYLKKAVKLKKGGQTPGKSVAGTINKNQIEEIAKEKMEDMNANTIDAAAQMVRGSALAMGLKVEGM